MDAILNEILIFANVMILFVLICAGVIGFLCMRFVTKGSKTFIFEELDEPSKDYLLAIGRNKGDGFPGVYIYNYIFGGSYLLTGIVFLGGIPFVNFADTFAEPKAQAMLQTALFLLGGWFVMLWFRRKGYFSTASNLNSFIFVDEKYYWNWSYYSVDVINIENIKFFECVRNDANQTYDFHLESDHGLVKMAISKRDEESASKLYSLLSYKYEKNKKLNDGHFPERKWKWLYVLTFGDPKHLKPVDGDDGFVLDESFKDLSSECVPDPFKARNENIRILNYGFSILVLGFVFFAFFQIDIFVRDGQIWESIQTINSDEKVYWLRIYLRDPRNIRHRDEAFKQLGYKYTNIFQKIGELQNIVDRDDMGNVNFISKQIPAIDPRNPNLHMLIPKVKLISVPDPKLIEGLQSITFSKMLDLQEPFLKLSVTPSDPASVDVSKFTGAITDAYIQSIISAFGSEYFIVSSSLDGPGHISIVYSFFEEKSQQKIRFDVSYRQTLESEPTEKISLEVNIPSRELQYVERAAKRLGVFTVGDQSGEWAFPN
jgi:hypothetical protein